MRMVIIVISLSEGQERHDPAVTARICNRMRLPAPKMADGVDAEGGVQHKKRAAHSRQQKTAQPAGPTVIEKAYDERQDQAGDNDRHIVAMLPEDHRILPQTRGVSFVIRERIPEKDPPDVTVPKSPLGVVRVLVLVAPSMVANMSRSP